MALTRRALLVSMVLAVPRVRASGRPLRLGGPVFIKSDDPTQLAHEHRRLGYSAAYCPAAKAADTSRVESIRDAFSRENVVIAEVGAWKNMLDPDPSVRHSNLDYVIERLTSAARGAILSPPYPQS